MSKTPDLNVNRTIGEIIASQRKPNIESETGWYNIDEEWAINEPITVGFTNAWAHAGTVAGITNAKAGWYLSDSGEVRFRGKISNTGIIDASKPVITILPDEVRPEYAQEFILPVDDDGNIDLNQIRYRAHQKGDV